MLAAPTFWSDHGKPWIAASITPGIPDDLLVTKATFVTKRESSVAVVSDLDTSDFEDSIKIPF
jgi:hypothetical protein